MSRDAELQRRCDNIRFQLDHFRTTDQERYRYTLWQLGILIRFTHNRRKCAAFQNILDEYKTTPPKG